jgi:hypothetical protein
MADDLKITCVDFGPQFVNLAKDVPFSRVFPNLLQALNLIAINHAIQWRKFTMGEQIPGAPRVINSRGDYTRSIHADLSKEQLKAVWSNGPWTDQIEKGHPEIDLKPGLLHGPKARMGKNGPYNIVPFRHGIPNSLKSNNPMPQDLYNMMRRETNKLDKIRAATGHGTGTSRIVGKGPGVWQRVSGAQDVKNNYQWGFRLPASKGGIPETKQTSQGDYTWKTGKHSGMVRMDTSTKKARSSEYITFRVVSYKSDPASWIVPKQDPIPIREKVVEILKEETQLLLKIAIEEDLK